MRLIYPGSFDPPTRGHIRIAKRAAALCGDVIVLVMANPGKNALFGEEERLQMLRKCLEGTQGVRVEAGQGLLADEVKRLGGSAILRGIRGVSDYLAEKPVAEGFGELFGIETLFMESESECAYMSSSLVKQLLKLGGPVQAMLPEEIFDDVMTACFQAKHLKGEGL